MSRRIIEFPYKGNVRDEILMSGAIHQLGKQHNNARHQQKHRPADETAFVHCPQFRGTAVPAAVAVVPHEEDTALRHGEGEFQPLRQMCFLPDVGFLQSLAIHIDHAVVKIYVHGLAPGGNDPLDNRLPVFKGGLGGDDYVPPLKIPAEDPVHHQQQISVLQRLPHGAARDAHHPQPEGEQHHRSQYGTHQRLGPLVNPPAWLFLLFPVLLFIRHICSSVGIKSFQSKTV